MNIENDLNVWNILPPGIHPVYAEEVHHGHLLGKNITLESGDQNDSIERDERWDQGHYKNEKEMDDGNKNIRDESISP